MSEYVRDADGDVWRLDQVDGLYYCAPYSPYSPSDLAFNYSPLTPCDADGRPTPLALPAEVRSLVAAAFEDLGRRLSAEWCRSPMRYDPFASAVLETAAAIRAGEVTSSSS